MPRSILFLVVIVPFFAAAATRAQTALQGPHSTEDCSETSIRSDASPEIARQMERTCNSSVDGRTVARTSYGAPSGRQSSWRELQDCDSSVFSSA
jgi:hypothetical protein